MTVIIDYRAGNAPSVLNAVGQLGRDALLSASPADLLAASRIILPGVGSARATMDSLTELGLLPALNTAVLHNHTPFLGICVGMQILFDSSDEDGGTACLGWLPGRVVRYDNGIVRVPQMGWNQVVFDRDTPVLPAGDGYYYFVNSYHAITENSGDIWGRGDYGGGFTAAVNRGNIYGTQFHAEKSGQAGLNILRGFIC